MCLLQTVVKAASIEGGWRPVSEEGEDAGNYRNVMIRAALYFQLILCLLLIAPTAQADEPYTAAKAYWVDASRLATFDDARSASYASYQGTVTEGYTKAAVWVRMRLSGATTREPLALIVKPAFLSRIELYDPLFADNGGKIRQVVSGRDAQIEPGNHVGFDNGFIIAASAQPRDVFLRITTETSLSVDIRVLPLGEAEKSGRAEGAILAVYFALLLGFCLWGLANLAIRREGIYALFVARMVYSMAHLFVFIGLLRYFLSDELSASTRNFVYNFVTVTIFVVTGSFDVRILSDFGASPSLRRIFRLVLLLPAVSLILLLSGRGQAALHFNALIITAAMILLCLLALSVRDTEKTPYQRSAVLVVRFGFLLMAGVIVVPAFMHQNLIKTNPVVINLLFLHAVISATILSAVLSIRARQLDWLAQQALFQYRLKEQELRVENERRIEKERFLSMLTHELRNPLALIRLVANPDTASGRTVEKAALEMAGVIERVEQSEKLDDKAVRLDMARLDLEAVLQDLAAHAPAAARVDVTVNGDCTIVTDEALLRSSIRNLLDNASKYSPATSRIRVIVASHDVDGEAAACISISNEVGDAGVPDRDKLFTKYYRNRGAHRHPGSGLGLFLVAHWAQAIGAGSPMTAARTMMECRL